MIQEWPRRIADALNAEESGPLNEIIAKHSQRDLVVLRSIARNEDEAFEPSEQRKALYALGRWGEKSLVTDIAQVLPGLDTGCRMAAIDALGRLGGDPAIEALSEYVNDESPQVRKFVVTALKRVGTRKAGEMLRRMAAEKREEAWLRDLAIEAASAVAPRGKG